jgi:uncharacterized protein YdhG (YjbR/CyaY superfamily)
VCRQTLFEALAKLVAKSRYTSVAEYIASHPAPTRRVLRQVRSAIRKALPGAEETISYQIPAYKLGGRTVIYFAGWKAHYSLYPATRRLAAAFKKELAPYEVNDKGTIRFPLAEPVPAALIEGLATFRAREVAGDVKTKRTSTRKG